jgi:hypothetical protein
VIKLTKPSYEHSLSLNEAEEHKVAYLKTLKIGVKKIFLRGLEELFDNSMLKDLEKQAEKE